MDIFFMPSGNGNTGQSQEGLVAFKLFLALLIVRGASVSTVATVMLIGGLVALSIILKATAGKTFAAGGYHVERDQDQTWVRFDAKPTAAVQEALESTFGARWNPRQRAWRIRRRVRVADVARVIESARALAPTGGHEAQEVLACLEHIERKKHGCRRRPVAFKDTEAAR